MARSRFSLDQRVTVLVFCVMLTACERTLFSDDFEGYAAGQSVGGATPTPAQPAGDYILVQRGTPNLFRVTTADALVGQQSLRLERGSDTHPDLENCPPPTEQICEKPFEIFFIPDGLPESSGGPVFYTWQGRAFGLTPESAIEFSLFQPGLFFATRLRLRLFNDRLEAWQGTTLEATLVHPFGQHHTIILRVDIADRTYALQVGGPGTPVPPRSAPICEASTVICGAFAPADGLNPRSFLLRTAYHDESAPGSRYVLDNLHISQ